MLCRALGPFNLCSHFQRLMNFYGLDKKNGCVAILRYSEVGSSTPEDFGTLVAGLVWGRDRRSVISTLCSSITMYELFSGVLLNFNGSVSSCNSN